MAEERQKVFGFYLPTGADSTLFKQSVLAYISVVFLAVVYVAFVIPKFSDIANLTIEVNKLQSKVDSINKTIDALDSFKTQVGEKGKDSTFRAIPASFDPGYILLSLRKLALDNGVGLTNYSLAGGKTTQSEDIKKKNTTILVSHVVKVEISGSPLNLINFVESLDKYLPIASVTNLSISEVSKILFKTTNEAKLTMELTYYHLPVAEVGVAGIGGKYIDLKDLDTIRAMNSFSRLEETVTTPSEGESKQDLFAF